MHQLGSTHDVSAEGSPDGLVAEADAQYRHFAREVTDERNADACFLRSAGPGRENDALWLQVLDLLDG